jgi:hypothetical protein
MSEAKSEHIKLVEPESPEDVFNDIAELRRTGTLKVSRRVIPINVKVGKPPNNVYFRAHPSPDMALDASVIIGDGGSDDFYFIHPRMLNHHTMLPRLRKVTIAVIYSWPGGTISLWPVPITGEKSIPCWKSGRAAFEMSKVQWVQLVWNSDARDYDVAVAEGINTEPIWPPDLDLSALLRLGFSDKIIADPDHDYVRRLRGAAE